MKQNIQKIKVHTMIKIGVAMLALTVMSYVYLVNAATFDTAKSQKLSEEISVVQSEISELEFAYIEKTKSISLNSAAQYALVPNKKESKKILVSRDSNVRLTLNQ